MGDGTLGWPDEAPYDAIVVTAGGPDVPAALRDQLAVGFSMSLTCCVAGVLGAAVLYWGLKPFSATAQAVAGATA